MANTAYQRAAAYVMELREAAREQSLEVPLDALVELEVLRERQYEETLP